MVIKQDNVVTSAAGLPADFVEEMRAALRGAEALMQRVVVEPRTHEQLVAAAEHDKKSHHHHHQDEEPSGGWHHVRHDKASGVDLYKRHVERSHHHCHDKHHEKQQVLMVMGRKVVKTHATPEEWLHHVERCHNDARTHHIVAKNVLSNALHVKVPAAELFGCCDEKKTTTKTTNGRSAAGKPASLLAQRAAPAQGQEDVCEQEQDDSSVLLSSSSSCAAGGSDSEAELDNSHDDDDEADDEETHGHAMVMHLQVSSGVSLVSPREFVIATRHARGAREHRRRNGAHLAPAVMRVGRSVAGCPGLEHESKGFSRGHIELEGWWVEQTAEGELTVSYVISNNIGGSLSRWVPASVLERFVVDQPCSIAAYEKLLHEKLSSS